ncbi:DUF1232 domain-containing protein [Oxalobacteraceae bacterium OM1]|nr:DUF1232 domain-containing protein [Oxalobacteraceae bacterium OM1]
MFSRLRRLLRLLTRDGILLWHACRHPQAPGKLRLAALLLVLYVLSPIDLIPDWIPVLGWLDDVTILAFAVPFLLRFMPPSVMADAAGATDRFLSRMRPGMR